MGFVSMGDVPVEDLSNIEDGPHSVSIGNVRDYGCVYAVVSALGQVAELLG